MISKPKIRSAVLTWDPRKLYGLDWDHWMVGQHLFKEVKAVVLPGVTLSLVIELPYRRLDA